MIPGIQPIGLQLSRRKGFDLQALSRATNGLPAIKVARPTLYGNPFSVAEFGLAQAVALHHTWITRQISDEEIRDGYTRMVARFLIERRQAVWEAFPKLRGHNLACFCEVRTHGHDICHRRILLELANK